MLYYENGSNEVKPIPSKYSNLIGDKFYIEFADGGSEELKHCYNGIVDVFETYSERDIINIFEI